MIGFRDMVSGFVVAFHHCEMCVRIGGHDRKTTHALFTVLLFLRQTYWKHHKKGRQKHKNIASFNIDMDTSTMKCWKSRE